MLTNSSVQIVQPIAVQKSEAQASGSNGDVQMCSEDVNHNISTNPVVQIVKRKRGAPPGNKNRQRHGLRSKSWVTLRARIQKEIRQSRALLGIARAK